MTLTHSTEPRIRVYDVMAQGASDTGLEIATGRQIDLPVNELARLLALLGGDGLQAFCLYLEHLEHVSGVDGSMTLGVPHFSARWLLSASIEAAELTGLAPLSKNAATRGHQAVERSGLLHALPNPPAVPGQGARGRTFRAVLNPRLVIIRGGRDDIEDLPRVRRGRPRKDQPSPVSQEFGNREDGAGLPTSGIPKKQSHAPVSHHPRNREAGQADAVPPLASTAFPESRAAEATSAVGVVQQLLSSDNSPGLLATSLVPALRHNRAPVIARLRTMFNDVTVSERAADVVAYLGLPGEATRRPDILADLLADTLLGDRDTPADLLRLGVSGAPLLTVTQLRERLVVGLMIGCGLRRVASWGAWLHQATRPEWTPKPGPLLNELLGIARTVQSRPSSLASTQTGPEPFQTRPEPVAAPTTRRRPSFGGRRDRAAARSDRGAPFRRRPKHVADVLPRRHAPGLRPRVAVAAGPDVPDLGQPPGRAGDE